jgi:hypothetical protein
MKIQFRIINKGKGVLNITPENLEKIETPGGSSQELPSDLLNYRDDFIPVTDFLSTITGKQGDFWRSSANGNMLLTGGQNQFVRKGDWIYIDETNTKIYKQNIDVSDKVDKATGERLITAAEIIKLANQEIADASVLSGSKSYTDSLIDQIKGGIPFDSDTLKKINDKVIALQSIVGGTTPDGDTVVNTLTELMAVLTSYPEGTDLFTLVSGKVSKTDIYNALDCVVSGKVADARQLKVLNDLITSLTTDVAGKQAIITDVNFGSFQNALPTVNAVADTDKMPFLIGSLSRMITWANFKGLFKTINGNSIFGPGSITTPDMDTTSAQDVYGIKTFLAGMFGLRNTANTFTSFFASAVTASRTWTWPDKDGTVAMTTDIKKSFTYNLDQIQITNTANTFFMKGATGLTYSLNMGTNDSTLLKTLNWNKVAFVTPYKCILRKVSLGTNGGVTIYIGQTPFGTVGPKADVFTGYGASGTIHTPNVVIDANISIYLAFSIDWTGQNIPFGTLYFEEF